MKTFACMLFVVLSGQAASDKCGAEAAIFYDEMHSFGVSAPRHWCVKFGPDKQKIVLRPASPDRSESIVVSYALVEDPKMRSSDVEAAALRRVAGNDVPRHVYTQNTAAGIAIEVWRLSASGKRQFIAFRKQESILIQFVMLVDHAIAPATVPQPFLETIYSFHTNVREK